MEFAFNMSGKLAMALIFNRQIIAHTVNISPPQTCNAKNPLFNQPPEYKPPEAYTWKLPSDTKNKQRKNGSVTQNIREKDTLDEMGWKCMGSDLF